MNNTTIINNLNSDNRNVANIKSQHHQIMKAITNRILKFELMIKKSIVTNHTFVVAIFSRISSFTYINSIVIQRFIKPTYQILILSAIL